MRAGRRSTLFLGNRFFYAHGNVSQFQEAAAVRRAAGTVLPGAFAGRPFQAITRGDPEVFGNLFLLLIRFFWHECCSNYPLFGTAFSTGKILIFAVKQAVPK